MAEDPNYKLYLEEKFNNIDNQILLQFEKVHSILGSIKEQTTKTNGRVTDLESQIGALDKAFAIHPVNCNSANEIKDIKKDLEEYRMIKKYPKLALIIIAFFIVTTIISIRQVFKVSKQVGETEMNIKKRIDAQEGISKVTRGGYVKYNDLGLSDSVKVR
jgi:hypothetical protein